MLTLNSAAKCSVTIAITNFLKSDEIKLDVSEFSFGLIKDILTKLDWNIEPELDNIRFISIKAYKDSTILFIYGNLLESKLFIEKCQE